MTDRGLILVGVTLCALTAICVVGFVAATVRASEHPHRLNARRAAVVWLGLAIGTAVSGLLLLGRVVVNAWSS